MPSERSVVKDKISTRLFKLEKILRFELNVAHTAFWWMTLCSAYHNRYLSLSENLATTIALMFLVVRHSRVTRVVQ